MANRRTQAQSSAGSTRQNEYFVPRDGIDREVITADICRYLGNDALVRPGNYADDSGRTIQGYYITAYRNLTSAMIADLKNDSARWDQERRKHQSGAVRYQDSAIHRGGSSGYSQSSYSGTTRDYAAEAALKYPGNEAPGYSSSQAATATYGGASGYSTQPGYYGTQAGYSTQPGYTASGATATGGASYGSAAVPDPWSAGARWPVAPTGPDYMDASMPDAPQRAATSGYPSSNMRQYSTQPQGYGYPPTTSGATYAQPVDSFYGRASPAGNPMGYSPGPATNAEAQYDETLATSRAAATTSTTQATTSGTTQPSRRDRERERDRERDRDRDRTESSTKSRKGGGHYHYAQ